MTPILEVQHLTKYFTKKNIFGKKEVVKATDDVSFNVKKGEIFVLAGESGSGKSTIARLILGGLKPQKGKVIFDGEEVTYQKNGLRKIRLGCQMIQQDPYDSINPRMRIKEIVSEPLEIHQIGNKDSREKRVQEVLEEVKLHPVKEIERKHPHMLSGGQRQRVVLARALTTRPKIIIADEPVSMLDVSIRSEMLELMLDLQKKYNMSFIYITHDLATAYYFGQKIAILYRGKIIEMGPTEEVLLDPYHPYTQALLDAISTPDPTNLGKEKKIRIKDSENPTYKGCNFLPRCIYGNSKCREEPRLEEIKKDRKVSCFFPLGRR